MSVDSNPDSLLTFLARRGDHSDAEDVWARPYFADFLLRRDASLLYSLLLSGMRRNEGWVDHCERQLAF